MFRPSYCLPSRSGHTRTDSLSPRGSGSILSTLSILNERNHISIGKLTNSYYINKTHRHTYSLSLTHTPTYSQREREVLALITILHWNILFVRLIIFSIETNTDRDTQKIQDATKHTITTDSNNIIYFGPYHLFAPSLFFFLVSKIIFHIFHNPRCSK